MCTIKKTIFDIFTLLRDRILTIINCWSDCIVCGIVYHLSKKELNLEQAETEDEVLMRDLSKIRL